VISAEALVEPRDGDADRWQPTRNVGIGALVLLIPCAALALYYATFPPLMVPALLRAVWAGSLATVNLRGLDRRWLAIPGASALAFAVSTLAFQLYDIIAYDRVFDIDAIATASIALLMGSVGLAHLRDARGLASGRWWRACAILLAVVILIYAAALYVGLSRVSMGGG